MITKTVLGLATASLFALAPVAHAQEVKTKDPVVSSQSLVLSPLLIAGGVAVSAVVVAVASSGGDGGGSSNNTVLFGN